MKLFGKSLLVVAASSAVLMGCKAEGEGEGSASSSFSLNSVALKSPTYVIADGNTEVGTSVFDNTSVGFEIGMDAGMSRTFGADVGQRAINALSQRTSESETLNCDTGTMTLTVTSDDITSSGEPQESGSMTFGSTFNNCYDDWDEQTVNGSLSVDFSWSGYDSNNGFGTMSVVMEFSDLNITSTTSASSLDGAIVYGLSQNEISLDWALSMSGDETNNQIITTRTTETIVMNVNSESKSGSWVVNGANGTKAEVSLLDNGYTVTVNNGSAVTVTM